MLKREGVDYGALPRVDHQGNPRDLLAGRADAMVAYSTNAASFVLEQLGAAYRTFSPGDYGNRFLWRQSVHLRSGAESPPRTGWRR